MEAFLGAVVGFVLGGFAAYIYLSVTGKLK